MLRKLLDRLKVVPFEEGGHRGYRFVTEGTYARLVVGAVQEQPARADSGRATLPPMVVPPG